MGFVPQKWQTKLFVTAGLTIWALALSLGMARLWKYEGAAGAPASPPLQWPQASHATRSPDMDSLVVLMHPRCPCSRATVEELSKLMTHCQGKLTATVLLIQPQGTPDGWEHTDLWTSAAAIPGVIVKSDPRGLEAARFGAATSGQVFLYSPTGQLLFSGGITESRGHSGDNQGRSFIEALVLHEIEPLQADSAHTPVYGCPLFDSKTCQNDGANTCRK
jgi:hypothetical protein